MVDPIAEIEQTDPGLGRLGAILKHLASVSGDADATHPEDRESATLAWTEAVHKARLAADSGHAECFTCRWAQPLQGRTTWQCRRNAPSPAPLSRVEIIGDDVGGPSGVLIGHEPPHAESSMGYALARPIFLKLDHDDVTTRDSIAFWPSVMLDEWCGQWERYEGPARPHP